jgi:hypothetical protein
LSHPCYREEDRGQPSEWNTNSPPKKVQVGSDLSAKHRQKEDDSEQNQEAEPLQLCEWPC